MADLKAWESAYCSYRPSFLARAGPHPPRVSSTIERQRLNKKSNIGAKISA
jgi:hypothetical protein